MSSRILSVLGGCVMMACLGCGGGGGGVEGGPSIADEYKRALESDNPEAAAKALVAVAYKYNNAKDSANAEKAAGDAAIRAAKITDFPARAAVFNSVAAVQGTLRLKSATKQSLQEVAKAADKIEVPETKAASLAYMAATYSKHMEEKEQSKFYFDEAEKIATGIMAPNAKTKALLAVASHANRLTDDDSKALTKRLIELAGQTAEAIETPRDKADALADFAAQLDKMKRGDDAKAAYAKAVAAANGIPEASNKCGALTYIAERMCSDPKHKAEAEKLLATVEGLIPSLDPGLRGEIEMNRVRVKNIAKEL